MSKHVLFHQGIEAFNRRDVDAFLEICHPDCELQPFLRARDDDSPYRASDGIRQWFAATDAAFEEVRKEAVELREANGTLLALGKLHFRGRASGVEVTSPVGWVLEFRDGKIARSRTYIDPDQAVEEASLDQEVDEASLGHVEQASLDQGDAAVAA